MEPMDVLKEALRLHEENPSRRILFWVRNDECCDPLDHAYTAQRPVLVECCRGCWDKGGDGRWMDEDEALDDFSCTNDEASEEEVQAMFDRVAVDIIAIRLNAYEAAQ